MAARVVAERAKWRWAQRAGQLPASRALGLAAAAVALFQALAHHGEWRYEHVPRAAVPRELHLARHPALPADRPPCPLSALDSPHTLYGAELPARFDDFQPTGIVNGSWAPAHCTALLSVALLVPYRDRQAHWDVFLPYMHDFLRKQNVHYKIFLIEQQDAGAWNKGALLNVGARAALAERWPCLLLHDVDLLPLDAANLAACARRPRHLSAAVDSLRYTLPYAWLLGGAAAVRAPHYVRANGFSNRFLGWGGEDDNFALRLQRVGLQIVRFPREMSRYVMLRHPRATAVNAARHRLLRRLEDSGRDGLSSVRAREVRVRQYRLFTLVGVKF